MKTIDKSVWLIALLAMLQTPSLAADASRATAKSAEQQTNTWQAHLKSAQVLLHTREEDANRPIPKVPPEADVEKARLELEECVKLALATIKPLEGLKKEQLSKDILWLTTSIGAVGAYKALTIAALFSEFKNVGNDIHQQLALLTRTAVIGRQLDNLYSEYLRVIELAYGKDGANVEFKSNDFPPETGAVLVAAMRQAVKTMHDATVKADAEIVKLKQQELTKPTWQEHLVAAQRRFHITEKERLEHQKQLKSTYMFSTAAELAEARAELYQTLRVALKTVKPGEGLQSKETASEVMTLALVAGYAMGIDSLTIETLVGDPKKEDPNTHHRLSMQYRVLHIAQRIDEISNMTAEVFARAFGKPGSKPQFTDKEITADKLAAMAADIKKVSDGIRKQRVSVEAEIKRLQKLEDSGK
jgi:roadblock/LC7 domain-containing protein